MKKYARIQDGRVAEVVSTDAEISKMFHRDIAWIDITPEQRVTVGWEYDGRLFSPPTLPEPVPTAVTVADLQAQIVALSAKLEELSKLS